MQVGVDQTSYPLLRRLATWTAQVRGEQVVQEKPKSRLEVHAPQSARFKAPMKVRILFPGRKVGDVTYRREECGAEVIQSKPRAR
jgi:hypothetical protein